MTWSRHQVVTVQIYRRAAGLPNQEYRQLLKSITGVSTSRAALLTNYDFDRVMPALEVRLHLRVDNNLARWPMVRGRLAAPYYWRQRCPGRGGMNSRQRHKIFTELWPALQPALPPDRRGDEYLAAIAAHAAGCRIASVWDMTSWQAHILIEALKDRLAHKQATGGAA